MNILQRFFTENHEKYLGKLRPQVEKIAFFEEELKLLSLEQFPKRTREFKEQLSKDAQLDILLPEAFALVREVSRRTLQQRHFDVQLIEGMVLHEGKNAEMKTGKEKTLTATLPAYLNALEDKGVHIITVNDYLAKRDTVWMGQIYHTLGLSVSCITHNASYIYDPSFQQEEGRDEERDTLCSFQVEESYLRPISRKDAYAADITYGTNNEFGFDYLRDNMAQSLEAQVQRGHHYAIIDEVDSVLVDEARTPLIISAPDQESTSWYQEFAALIPKIKKGEDDELDEK